MKKIKIDMFQEYVSKLIFRCCVFFGGSAGVPFRTGLF